jgi:hypothetical protein
VNRLVKEYPQCKIVVRDKMDFSPIEVYVAIEVIPKIKFVVTTAFLLLREYCLFITVFFFITVFITVFCYCVITAFFLFYCEGRYCECRSGDYLLSLSNLLA